MIGYLAALESGEPIPVLVGWHLWQPLSSADGVRLVYFRRPDEKGYMSGILFFYADRPFVGLWGSVV